MTKKKYHINIWPDLIVIFICLFIYLSPCLYSIDNIDREKLALETNIEKRITNAISKLLSTEDFIVMVNIEPIIEKISETKKEEEPEVVEPEEKKPVKRNILPGVPTKKNLIGEDISRPSQVQVVVPSLERESTIMKEFIKKITITVKFDISIPDNVVEEAKNIIAGLVKINPSRGDVLLVEKTNFYKKKMPWWHAFTSFPTILWFLGIILFAFFLFGPLNIFFKHLLRTLSAKPAAQQPLDNVVSRNNQAGQGLGFMGGVGGTSSVKMSLDDGKGSRPKMFSFITKGNLKNLAYLLKDESPDRAALVLSYLDNEWASFVMSQLPDSLQSKVAVELANVKQLDPDDVEVMELELKKKIDYLIGGSAQIVDMCERSDKKTKENILSALSTSNPDLAEQVKLQLLDINDLYFIDSIGLRVLFREIPLPSWAIGLKAARDITREKVIKTLPAGAAEMLKQEIELNQMVPPAKIDEEERNIIMTIRKFRDEGRITIVKGEMPAETSEAVPGTETVSSDTEIDTGSEIKQTLEQEVEQIPEQEVKQKIKQETEVVAGKSTETREERLAKIKEKLKRERGG
ncbi:MAG: hypothetical protein JW983_10320 [Elusimicrobia bacterium]|nr:hypothetical protein [Elusimicrobiota bacterium]